MKKRIHILDDEPDMVKIATDLLEPEGFVVTSSTHPKEGLLKIRQNPPDLLLLDLRLPDIDGYQVCRTLRADPKTANIPIIMVSVRSDEVDAVVGLQVGADDYIIKPFRRAEMVARVKAALRRSDNPTPAERLTVGPIALDFGRYAVTIGKKEVAVTPKEFELLGFLLRRVGRVLTRAAISESVWGIEYTGSSRTIDVHIDQLRKKLGKYGEWIVGLKGVGYRFDPEA